MDTVVENRSGFFVSAIKNHLLSSGLFFLMFFTVFSWFILAWDGAVIVFDVVATIFYLSRVYSYSYDQPKLDMIIKKKHDFISPLKIGGCYSLIIFVLTFSHYIVGLIDKMAGLKYGIFVRVINFPFNHFIYGMDGNGFSIPVALLISVLPIAIAYLSYGLAVKNWSLTKVHDNVVYESRKK